MTIATQHLGGSVRLPSLTITAAHGRRLAGAVLLSLAAIVAVAVIVDFGLGALTEHNAQARLVDELAARVQATQANRQLVQPSTESGLLGSSSTGPQVANPADLTLVAPPRGTAVALIQVPRLHLSQVVLEGAQPAQLEQGPGHVPGTALPGQPGTSAVVGTRTRYGAVLRDLPALRAGDEITVVTPQGRATYRVDSQPLGADPFADTATPRLVLATSGPEFLASGLVSRSAHLVGTPYAPTPRGARDLAEDGLQGDTGGWPSLVLLLEVLAVLLVASVLLYRRWHRTSTWLLTTPPLLLVTVAAATVFSRLLPAAL